VTVLVGPGGLGPAERDEPAEPGVERRTELRAVRGGVAFPSISTGAYGYPLAEAAAVSMQALCRAVTAVQSVQLVAFDHRVQELWEQALEA